MYNQLFHRTHRFLYDVFKFPKFISSLSRFNSTIVTLNSDPKVKTVQDRKGEESFSEEEEEEAAVLNKEGFPDMFSIEPKDNSSSHPWPEWVNLMEHLSKKGYYHERNEYPFGQNEMSNKDSNLIRTACLNFGRDRFDVIRYLSKKDIRVIVRCGCPSLDRKVVNSGKRLRAYLGIDERNVCSSCCLRGSCERAYVNSRKDEGGRTVDVMRILMTYGLNPVIGSVENKLALNKRLKNSVRKLLTETVEFSNEELDTTSPEKTSLKGASYLEHSIQPQTGQITVPMKKGDWICPTCNFMNFAKNAKCLRCEGFSQQRLKRSAEDQDHPPSKRGDWLCGKCNLLNFAKNTRCFQCKEKPSNRHLGPGEWECESCNYVNFRKNMACINCDWKRPKASNYSDNSAQRQSAGLHQPYSMSFARHDGRSDKQFSDRQERQSQKPDTKFWSSEESNEDESCLSSFNPELVDFSIPGDEFDISQDPQAREKWEEDMSKVRRIVSAERENNTEIPKKLGSLQSAEDSEMDDWFGHRNKL
ncbi:uncharacterized protein LOC113275346 [Papaver somniferum]|uniref:uncharacterized protein LOC113275346 n=1 Tax=Papaver somniferum TaxID=3469 RepID=UPI000E6FEA88|nr:uncharacterized protein LOC113275346 [Papaver somniferum]